MEDEMIQRTTPTNYFNTEAAKIQEQKALANSVNDVYFNGVSDPVPTPAPTSQPQIAYTNEVPKPEIPWGLIGVISIVGLISLAIVAVVVGGKK